MAVKYLRSAAAGAGTGTTWADAYTTLNAAIAGVVAGDTIYVADDHAETGAVALTIANFPGTATNPNCVICVNTHVTMPPTGLATSATVTTTGGATLNFGSGFAYIYGVTFSAASGATGAGLTLSSNTTGWGYVLENCQLTLGSTASTAALAIGITGSAKSQFLKLINSKISFGHAGQKILPVGGRFVWQGASSAIAGTTPTTLFIPGSAAYGIVEVTGVDLSALGSGKNLVSFATPENNCHFAFRNCKLGASVSAITGTLTGAASDVLLDNCDSGSGNTRMEHYKVQGSILTETTKVKSSGASDGTTTISHKFTSLTAGPTLFSPLEGPWMSAWNETLSSLTATVDFLHDSLTNLQNADIYLEVEYLGTSGFPQSVYSNNRVADVFAVPADCPASAATWTTTGLTNPNKQALSVTFTPTIKGPIRWRVCLVHNNYTVYVDPQASGLATPSREYLIPGSAYVNETGTGGGGAAGMLFIPSLDGV